MDTNPQLVQHVTTVEAAKDLDVLRALVGDEQLDYYGASYGTFLGATYAALFPERVRGLGGAAPILVIGTTGDPATPVESARKLADAGSAILVGSVALVGHRRGPTGYGRPTAKGT